MNRQLRVSMIPVLAMSAGLACVPAPDVDPAILGTPDPTGEPFVKFTILERTFTAGKAVVTHTFAPTDLTRTAIEIDFNGDGRADPVVGYGSDTTDVVPNQAVVQILLSQPGSKPPAWLSLTLDEPGERGDPCPGMSGLQDVAVGDIDNDGKLDIIVATGSEHTCPGGIFYLHHPKGRYPNDPGQRPLTTTDLRYWDINPIDASDDLAAAVVNQVNDVIGALIPRGCTLLDFEVDIEHGFANVELADMDGDGNLDVVASQFIEIVLTPERDVCTNDTIVFNSGQIAILWNPGGDTTGHEWGASLVGIHERFQAEGELDRAGASGLFLVDLDKDRDFDIISSARLDNNVQVAWFENPRVPAPIPARACRQRGGVESAKNPEEWCQWRIGSLRDAFALDFGDVTGDDKLDVVATGGAQKQVILFEQPEGGPKREYDWDTFVIGEFDNYEPMDIHIVDIDGDGAKELVVGASEGAVRRFEPPKTDPRREWTAKNIFTFTFPTQDDQEDGESEKAEQAGGIGLLGVVDLDDDGDFDIVTVVDAGDSSGNKDLIAWIRNGR